MMYMMLLYMIYDVIITHVHYQSVYGIEQELFSIIYICIYQLI